MSKDLREGIRLSIEIIANDVLRRRQDQGLPLDKIDGQPLARQSLRYLYRILFLLYAEASPEMGVLPVGAGEYSEGYGLDRLRELTLTPLNSRQSRSGTHIYQSLGTLFRLVDQGHRPSGGLVDTTKPEEGSEGLHFDSLKADLFDPKAMQDIDRVGLGNAELQKVLQHLLLSKEATGKDRGFISYAELGVNQLGAVYEGLMSYTGFIAETDLYEVAKDGDSSKGSWVVPIERSESIDRRHFVTAGNDFTGELEPVLHQKGTFVFRLAGRERQRSASYYTPEVLTRFVVSQALEELLDQDGTKTTADEILKLTVCEPALGSGAFAIEAVRQLADEYLKRKQKELDKQIPAEDYAVELQKVKAQIALHQVFGVDLNSTAVELAEVSLWLDTMVAGLQAPWFGLHLRRGNSLIGARRATYTRAAVSDKTWLTNAPADAPLAGLADAMAEGTDDPNVVGRIHHFLLPAAGWGAASEAKEVKDLAGDSQKELKTWRNRIKAKPTKTQVDRLVNLGRRVETLWQFTLRRLEVAEAEARRTIDYFGKVSVGDPVETPVSREEIEHKLGDPNGAYQRLRRVMDAWNALWFWPLKDLTTDATSPPNLEEWLSGLEGILGVPVADRSHRKYGLNPMQGNVFSIGTWTELNTAEENELILSGVKSIDEVLVKNPWLTVCEEVSALQGFFHWELDFASVFADGGFDLQTGNPPWVRPAFDEAAVLAEGDPWWKLASKASQATLHAMRKQTLGLESIGDLYIETASATTVLKDYLGSNQYTVLEGLQPDLYRCFMVHSWRARSANGVVALVHPESHFTEKKAVKLRRETYRRIRRHWQFLNILSLFEIAPVTYFGVHVYGAALDKPAFLMASSAFHPETIERSLVHKGGGDIPGLKTPDGRWDQRPHAERILQVDETMLATWAQILEDPGVPAIESRMLYPINAASSSVLRKLALAPRVRDLGIKYSAGWHETADRRKGYFEVGSQINSTWADVIMQGPFFSIATPLDKQPNPTMKSKSDYSVIDLESLQRDFIPRTSYQRSCPPEEFARSYTNWPGVQTNSDTSISHGSAADVYRMVWRRMAQPANARTLQPALIPPGPTHVDAIFSAGGADLPLGELTLLAGACSSIVLDFWLKVSGITDIRSGPVESLPRVVAGHPLASPIQLRTLRLNCLTESYKDLWSGVFSDAFAMQEWVAEGLAKIDRRLP